MLEQYDPGKTITEEEYKQRLKAGQAKLAKLGWQVYQQKRPVIIAYEGWDAGGKGGNIRRLVEALDPRGYRVLPIAAPKGEERTHHYLWRFWNRIPANGEIAIFDRTWYGRVLVERVEGFAKTKEWQRSYREINEFEQELIDFGAIIFKFWIHISKQEQLDRFKAREITDYKSWKLTDEDWRNRDKWDVYEEAVDEMLLKTSTPSAPWTVVEGNSKHHARVKVVDTVVKGLKTALK